MFLGLAPQALNISHLQCFRKLELLPTFDFMGRMNRWAIGAVLFVLLAVVFTRAANPLPIETANVLPLALSDDFQFRKFTIFRNTPPSPKPGATPIPTRDLMIQFERKRRLWGGVDAVESAQHIGQYFAFFWRAKRQADLTLRLEYRQTNLQNYVQAREIHYPNARGSHASEFAIVGRDYYEDGPITTWRAVLIEDRRIVALLQSRTWR
jgi:hypothetical protein